MLEKPDLSDEKITACLVDHFDLRAEQIAFLPLGADRNTAVYRVVDGVPYFVKLRRGDFDPTTVIVPNVLHDQGISQVIAPLSTGSGQLWANLDEFKVMVFPFIEGRDGYEVELTDEHWVELGRAFRGIHAAVMPAGVNIPREVYSAQWRDEVREFQAQAENRTFGDPVAVKLAALMRQQRDVISGLVRRADELAAVLKARALPFVVCHADIHAGNVLITADGKLYVVDWDTLILAPKERDLMFVGGGQFVNQRRAEDEERLFYAGYGPTEADPVALAYYRYERIVQDIAAYCEQILLTEDGGEDRENGLRQLSSQFLPDGVIAFARRTEVRLPVELRGRSG